MNKCLLKQSIRMSYSLIEGKIFIARMNSPATATVYLTSKRDIHLKCTSSKTEKAVMGSSDAL